MASIPNPDREYLDKLEEFLSSEDAPFGCMEISELDGFLTGLAVGPEDVPPEEWIPLAWGETLPDPDNPHTALMLAYIGRRYAYIVQTMVEGKHTLGPLFWDDGDGRAIAFDWAEGFLGAIRLRLDAWQPLFDPRGPGELLMPILSLCNDDDGEPLFPIDELSDDALTKDIPNLIPLAVDEIYMFWREQALKPQPVRVAQKTGRNDPCPCGSGKKFKRCCAG